MSPPCALIDAVINAKTRSLSVCPNTKSEISQLLEARVEGVQPSDDAVVREDPAILQERMSVEEIHGAGGRIADMRDERDARQMVRFTRELGVLPRRDWLLAYHRLTVRPNTPRPVPSGFLLLWAARLSGASISQKVAFIAERPACKPNMRHMLPTVRHQTLRAASPFRRTVTHHVPVSV